MSVNGAGAPAAHEFAHKNAMKFDTVLTYFEGDTAVGIQLGNDEYQLSGQIKNILRTIPWPDGFPLQDRLEMTNQALTALFEEERRKQAAHDFDELVRRPGGLEAFEELIRDFTKGRKVELRAVQRQPQR